MSAALADPAANGTLDQIGGGNIDVQHPRQLDAVIRKNLSECIRLLDRAREAIEDKALLTVRLTETLADNADRHLVGDELARVHVGLCLFAERSALFYGFTKHIARGDMQNTVAFYEICRLCALAGTRRPHQNDVHCSISLRYFIKPS